ncbi:DUF2971 domain-containing protein [Clostridium bowmanii]|uniref:DUF2971 domain-containing protein n=1 Tax=Clostridium bowmanii TaxID=132925 RepID=UPI001C0D480D|nr:DUF2971 domain-containing protein [Clostridium bowmanii]MBU3188729.1 DUF2971 domain-containing protein [Clostridium bowmanii]MCA1073314.1 DUF2971 domain-containing protein [Clostridium bowmanii]
MKKNKYKLEEYLKLEQISAGMLYHYTDAAGLLGILQNELFWVSKSNFLNDFSEISYIDTVIKIICKDMFTDEYELIAGMILEEVHFLNFGKSMNVKEQNYYILSLTENPDSLALWSTYSNCFGYNIGLDGSDLAQIMSNLQNETPLGIHGKVIYDKAIQCQIVRDEINITKIPLLYNKYLKSKNTELIKELKDEISLMSVALGAYGLFFKDPLFSQEQEYRIVFFHLVNEGLSTKLNHEIKFRDRNGIIIPYIEVPMTNDKGYLPVRELMVGPKNNLDIAEHGIDFLLYWLKKKDVTIRRSGIPLRY